MSVETKPNKLVKGLVLDTFHTDVDNTVATYALNAQLEDQEGNHFHYGSEVGTTYIKNIPDTHVVIGHINMERNETVLFTTDGTNSTIGILSRNDDMSYQYEIKVDDSKQAKKLNFKKNTYIRGVYRLLNGCDKIIYFVDGINKDRRININQLDSYKTSDIEYIPPVVIPEEVIPEIPIVVDNTLQVIVYALSSATENIQLIRLLQTNVSAIGSVNAILESSQQGLVLIDVTLSGVALSTATLLRAALLETNVTAQATTIVDTIVTKIIDAQVQALANTTASAQISISVNATVDTVTETSATVQLSKVISTSVDALANSSSEALIGLVLVSTNTGSASISTADLYINRLLTSSVTAQGTTTAELIIAELLSSAMTASANTTANLQLADVLTTSVSGAATVTNATLDVSVNDAQAFFDRVTAAGGTLTTTERNAITTLVAALKANGTWTKMKAIYPMVGGGQANPAAACAQNLKSASFVGSFTGASFANTGVTFNGTSSFMNTNFNQSSNLINTSLHCSYYVNSGIFSSSEISLGIINSNTFISLRSDSTYFNQCDSDFTTVLSANFAFYCANRTSSVLRKGYRNGAVIVTSNSSSSATSNLNYFIGAANNSGTASNFSSNRCAFATIGDGLTDTEVANFYTAVQAFQTSLNRQVEVVSDPDAQAFINRVYTDNGTLTNQEANAVNQLVIDLKANGTWTKMKAIYPMVGSSAAACKQNLKSSSFTGTFSSGWTFASSGVTPNGANAFMNTGFTPSINFAANNSSFGVYSAINTIDNGTIIGVQSGASTSRLFMFVKYDAGGSGQFTHNSSTGPVFVLATSNALITSNRITASQHKIFRNNSELINFSSAEEVRANIPIYLSSTNLDGAAVYASNRPLSFAFIGDGLTNTEVGNYYTSIQTFQQSLNRQV